MKQVTGDALRKRINLNLAHGGQHLAFLNEAEGSHAIVDTCTSFVISGYGKLEEISRELGVLAEDEVVVPRRLK